MKLLNKIIYKILPVLIIASCLLAFNLPVSGQEEEKPKPEPTVILKYFANNNHVQYLLIQTVLKEGKKSTPLPKQVVKVFMDSAAAESMVAKTYTDVNGKAKIILPPALKDRWNSNAKHTFIGVLEATSIEDERTSEIEVTRSKIELDTANTDGTRTINIKMMALENDEWVPAKEVEMKVGISRLGSILTAGENEIYSTDSVGNIEVEFNKDSLPGDEKGNFMLVAKVEDNDQFGNLIVEKKVPWGIALQPDNSFFNQRTLWSTRSRAPLWLLFMVYTIVIGVWGTIIYLIFQIVKINKLGRPSLH